MNKKVINVSKKIPSLIGRFINLLWANMPKNWKLNYVYQKDTLYLVILVNNDIKNIERQYTYSDIKGRENDLFGLASDCAEEITHSIKKS